MLLRNLTESSQLRINIRKFASQKLFEIVDPHHHFFAPTKFQELHKTLITLGLKEDYLPSNYHQDFKNIQVKSSVHVEALPSNGVDEVKFVSSLINHHQRINTVKGIVASCDLSSRDCEEELLRLQETSALVKGVRWICNFDGHIGTNDKPVESKATWPCVVKDYSSDDRFIAGLGLLEKFNFSFDLQCNPNQLTKFASQLKEYPDLKVVIDHAGSLRQLGLQGNEFGDEEQFKVWQNGMLAMSLLPNCYVKLSMFSYSVPDWWKYPDKELIAQRIFLETYKLFGSKRCMFASNWPVDGEDGLTPLIMFHKYRGWTEHLSEEENNDLFIATASRFYCL